VPLDAARWIELHPAARGRLSELVEARPSADGECPQSGDLARRLAAANPQERTDLVEALVRAEVARVLRIPEKRVEADTHFVNLGMDSLRGLELRNRLGEALQLPLPAVLFFQYPTLGAVTGFVLDAFLRAQLGSDARGNGTVDALGNAPQEEEGRL
jgi:acyl carrier protein